MLGSTDETGALHRIGTGGISRMNAVRKITRSHQAHGRDNSSWQEQIDLAVSTPDPVPANLRITVAHYDLSLALREVLGADSGANFHTWATWGSKKAGRTIRQEDIPQLRTLTTLIGGGLGLLAAILAPHLSGSAHLLADAAGALLGGLGLRIIAQRSQNRASRLVLGGNITVLDDIGRQTAGFVSTFQGRPKSDPERLAGFLSELQPGPTETGGQDLLKHCFTHYYQARHAASRARKYEHMLLGNLYAILHEHIRLQPYIAGAMPRPAQRLITRYLLDFSLGTRTMSVAKDVVPLSGVTRLHAVESPELRDFLDQWDRTRDGVQGSRAGNWAEIKDRMAFICALFRTGHCDEGLFTAPYTTARCAEIEAGRVPEGTL
jgi:hypothetical protein